MVIGARLAFNSTFHSNEYISATARIIQADIEGSAIGRYFPVELGIQCDAAGLIEALIERLNKTPLDTSGSQGWREKFARERVALEAEREREARDDSTPLQPVRVLGEIRESLPENAIVTLDTGNVCLQAADRLAHCQAPGLVTPLDFGLVGFGYAAAIGASAAAPVRPVVSIMGDGGFGFTMGEINTAVANDLPVIAVVLDNGAWGAEKAYQNEFFGGRLLGAEIHSPRYDRVAELCGAAGYHVTGPGSTGEALRDALAKKQPTVIHVETDPDALSTLRKDLFKKNDED